MEQAWTQEVDADRRSLAQLRTLARGRKTTAITFSPWVVQLLLQVLAQEPCISESLLSRLGLLWDWPATLKVCFCPLNWPI